jgi:hypothetical protein
MKNLFQSCIPRQVVLDGTADFVVNLSGLPRLTEAEAQEFLDSNVLTSGMEMLLYQAFARMAGTGSASGIYKLSESMGGGKTQSMIVAGILARFPHLANLVNFKDPYPKYTPMWLRHSPVALPTRKSGFTWEMPLASSFPLIEHHQKKNGVMPSKDAKL